ncbi:hypothetical protein BT96DRAFT_1011442 [Gymnopus androsaceus JB14]|uniref:Protein kinase domain-containing protein n=1 Tax=Gymnopus androsaceus JB14 TaxID=1447944 RepID=A0A6A4ILD7_9AGAR|nr:hypothetical protein BT96DRAFT_1011442 [Gymnopus androsaceus JB14]
MTTPTSTSEDTSAEPRANFLNAKVSERHSVNSHSAFSSLSIRGILTGPGSGPFRMNRVESFPANRLFSLEDECLTENEGWDALPLPQNKFLLEIELTEQIAHGRIGVTYGARLQRILDRTDDSPIPCSSLESPQEFCVKLVKPQFMRSLAREAWFYEQLAELQGVVVPQFFGFFVAPLPDGITWIDAWGELEDEEMSCESHSDDSQEESYCHPDSLDDDLEDFAFREDGRQSKSSSRWNDWRHSPESPLVGVLLLELGSALERRTQAYFTEQEKLEFADLLDDLSSVGIGHCDFKFNNVLDTSHSMAQKFCPRHGRIHPYRVIDFDRSRKWGKTVVNDDDLYTRLQRKTLTFADVFWCL